MVISLGANFEILMESPVVQTAKNEIIFLPFLGRIRCLLLSARDSFFKVPSFPVYYYSFIRFDRTPK